MGQKRFQGQQDGGCRDTRCNADDFTEQVLRLRVTIKDAVLRTLGGCKHRVRSGSSGEIYGQTDPPTVPNPFNACHMRILVLPEWSICASI